MASEILTAAEVRAAAPGERMYRLRDGGNLFLQVEATGRKWWTLRYTFSGRQKSLSLGVYPVVSLAMARKAAKEAREQLAEGINPAEVRKAKGAKVETLADVAQEWLEKFSPGWVPKYAQLVRTNFGAYILPHLGTMEMNSITAPQLLAVLRRVEAAGKLDTARRLRTLSGQLWRYAIATGRAERDIAHDLRGALPPAPHKSMATTLEPERIGELLRAIDGYSGQYVTRCALQLTPLCLLRPGELQRGRWEEIDLAEAEWRIPFERMKVSQRVKDARRGEVAHVVPLSRQALEILRQLHEVSGHGQFVFPSIAYTKNRPISPHTLISALRRLGYTGAEQSVHGFRSMASTKLHELGYPSHLIEKQLSHSDRNKIRAAYNFADFLPERRNMLQRWADYLDQLKAGRADKVVPIRRTAGQE